MAKYYMYYLITFLIIILSIFGIIYTTMPRENYILDDFNIWSSIYTYETEYDSGDELYIYSNVEIVGNVQFENNEDLNFYDTINHIVFSIHIGNISGNGTYPVFYPLDETDGDNYKDYRLVGKFVFDQGVFETYVDFIYVEEFQPYATSKSLVELTIDDYSDYVIVPYLTGFMGLMFFIMVHFSKKRFTGDRSYVQGRHSSQSRKREKY